MERIVLGNQYAPKNFIESEIYSNQKPYMIIIKRFETEDISIPHYADTTEILVCDGLEGSINIGSERHILKGRQVFYVPPNCVHSTTIRKNDGVMFVLKISPKHLSNYINISLLLHSALKTAENGPFVCSEFDGMKAILNDLILHDDDVFLRISGIISVYRLLSPYFPNKADADRLSSESDLVRSIIRWTEENCDRMITTEDAAAHVGYSKYYFCRWFRNQAGMTYHDYLSRVKIHHACRLLEAGKSVQEVSHGCGYVNASYFIRLFRRYTGCTPKEYGNRFPSARQETERTGEEH